MNYLKCTFWWKMSKAWMTRELRWNCLDYLFGVLGIAIGRWASFGSGH